MSCSSSSSLLLASLGLLLLVADSSLAFIAPTTTRPSFGVIATSNNTNRRRTSSSFQLQATIYAAPDDDSSGETTTQRPNSWLYEDATEDYSYSGQTTPLSPEALELASSLSQHQLQQLARLAVAFSPSSRQLQLQNINAVSVLSLSESFIEVEAVVCDSSECVTLAVPINYPHQCSTVEDHDCVLNNIQTLDRQAATTIQQQQVQQESLTTTTTPTTNYAATVECQIDAEMMCELTSTDNLNLPDWWTPQSEITPSCVDICNNIKSILNTPEFHSQVKSLVVQELNRSSSSSSSMDYVVERAHVVSICPAGMYIRAIAKPVEILGEDLPLRVVAVTIQFEDKVVTSEELHSAVLGCVAAASMYAE